MRINLSLPGSRLVCVPTHSLSPLRVPLLPCRRRHALGQVEHEGKQDGQENHGGAAGGCRGHRRVAVVLLAEAERAAPVALRHAHVVHYEPGWGIEQRWNAGFKYLQAPSLQVYLKLGGARPPDVKGR